MVWLTFLAKIITPVVVAYKITTGSRFHVRGVATYFLAISGAMALYAGTDLMLKEDARLHRGRVTTGVVVERLSSSQKAGTRTIGRGTWPFVIDHGRIVTIKGFHFYDSLARAIVYDSPTAWVVVYRFGCSAPNGCEQRDFVTHDLWTRLGVGTPVNVRLSDADPIYSGRLDANPQVAIAAAELGISAVLFLIAGLISGKFTIVHHPEWVTVPAIVTAVEPVTYPQGAKRYRVRFAYTDAHGHQQESADEVVTNQWKTGDGCLAVYQPDRPDLASMGLPTA